MVGIDYLESKKVAPQAKARAPFLYIQNNMVRFFEHQRTKKSKHNGWSRVFVELVSHSSCVDRCRENLKCSLSLALECTDNECCEPLLEQSV